jgi:UDP-3-O-acyl-N-acetylglucosamine deacetylase
MIQINAKRIIGDGAAIAAVESIQSNGHIILGRKKRNSFVQAAVSVVSDDNAEHNVQPLSFICI